MSLLFVTISKKPEDLPKTYRDFAMLQMSSLGNVKGMKTDYRDFVVFGHWNC
jgi:hypothetical protein